MVRIARVGRRQDACSVELAVAQVCPEESSGVGRRTDEPAVGSAVDVDVSQCSEPAVWGPRMFRGTSTGISAPSALNRRWYGVAQRAGSLTVKPVSDISRGSSTWACT